MFDELLASPHRKGQTGIIATGQHESKEQLFNSINLPFFDLSRSPSNILFKQSNNNLL